jgi:hypothetical protein
MTGGITDVPVIYFILINKKEKLNTNTININT